MQIMLDDRSLFGNDAGEDEQEDVLISYFVNQPGFSTFLDPKVSLRIAQGRKGTGKSALLVRFAHDLRETRSDPKPLIISAVPSSLVAVKEPPQTDNSVVLENYWKQVVCAAINMEIARDMDFAWRDDQMALVETAEIAGFKGRNIVSALIARLISKISVGGFEIKATPIGTSNHEQLLKRLQAEKSVARPVWFLLDDIDAKFVNTAAQQAYVSSFFTACRHLVNDIRGIGIRATVRSDVFTSLRGAEDLDKVRQYKTEITWSAPDQKNILSNRVLAYIKRTSPDAIAAQTWNLRDNGDELIALVFEERMRWGNSKVRPDHVLRILASGRPRWVVQLCRMAGARAAAKDKRRIGVDHINQVMGDFGRQRLEDLYREHIHQFDDMKRLVESFSGGPKNYTTDVLLERVNSRYVERVGVQRVPNIDGKPFSDSLQIAKFLFMCGFINGRNSQNAGLDVPEFITYEMGSDLLEVDTNLDRGMTWELLPAYRNILQAK